MTEESFKGEWDGKGLQKFGLEGALEDVQPNTFLQQGQPQGAAQAPLQLLSQSLPKEAPPPLWAVCSRVQPLVGIPAPNPARSPQLVCDHAPLERLCFLLGQEETDKYSWISLSFPLCLLLSMLLTTSSCLAFNTGVCGT